LYEGRIVAFDDKILKMIVVVEVKRQKRLFSNRPDRESGKGRRSSKKKEQRMRISFGGGSSGNRSLYILMGLSVVLIIVLWQMINKVPAFLSTTSMSNSERRDKSQNRFDDDQKEALKKQYAGYWVYETDTVSENNLIHKKDVLELKDNGIVWQVISWDVAMPSGNKQSFHHVRTAYCNPFGVTEDGDTICETAVLKQAFIAGNDTCVDNNTKVVLFETWDVKRHGEKLELCNREYSLYTGDPLAFFPEGMIRIVDSISKRLCNGQAYVSEFVRSAMAAEFQKMVSSGDRAAEVTSIIDRYYAPAVIAENWRGFSGAAGKKLDVSFQITPEGSIVSMKLTTDQNRGGMFFKGLKFEMENWRFPRQVGGDARSVRMQYHFDLSVGDRK
jgi:hypothetical protein